MTYYERVRRHLQERGVWKDTVRKFPPNAIRRAVESILERIECDPELLDWGTMFEGLRDFDSIEAFIEHISGSYPIYGKGVDVDNGAVEGYVLDLLNQLDRSALLRILRRIETMLYGPPPPVVNHKSEFSPWDYIQWREWKGGQTK
jgi:hypothetical protein